MSFRPLRTPEEKVRRLQERLHQSAKRNPRRRFHQLYDKVWSPWVLAVAWRKVKANRGAPGPDGVSIQEIEAEGVEEFLEELSRELRERLYRAGAVRRVYIPKPNGKLRPLGIPNARDRVVLRRVRDRHVAGSPLPVPSTCSPCCCGSCDFHRPG